MGTESPADGGDVKPDTNNNNNNNNNNNSNNSNRQGGRGRKKKKQYQSSHGKSNFVGLDKSLATVTSSGSSANKVTQINALVKDVSSFATKNFGSAAAGSILNKKMVVLEPPDEANFQTTATDGSTTMSKLQELKFSKEYDEHVKEKKRLEEHLRRLYHLVLGQCDDGIQATLAEDEDYEAVNEGMDVLKLIKMIEGICFNSDSTTEPIFALIQALISLVTLRQGDRHIDDYLKVFTDTLKACNEAFGGEHAFMTAFSDRYVTLICKENGTTKNSLSSDDKKNYEKQGRERMEAMLFLVNADRSRYGTTVDALRQDYIKGSSTYPKNLHTAYSLLKSVKSKRNEPYVPSDTGHTFNTNGDQDGETLVNDGGGNGQRPPCSRCGRTNHSLSECRAKRHDDGTLLHMEEVQSVGEVEDDADIGDENAGVEVSSDDDIIHCGIDYYDELIFHQSDSNSTYSRNGIPAEWILLDSQSSIDVFCNQQLLTRIYEADSTMRIRCNAGVKETNLRGYLTGYGWVWYYPEGIANILSLSRVKEQFRVTYDSSAGNCFQVHKENGKILNFREATRRLYYFDTANRDEEQSLLVNTVADNISQFSAYDVANARKARNLQRIIGRPSTKDYLRYVKNNLIPNCPVTTRDILNAEAIWGPDIGSLKGKTVRRKPMPIRVTGTNIPLQIMQKYRDVTLSVDIMKVTGIPFLMSISRHIKFGSSGKLDTMKNEHILQHFKAIVSAYAIRGFRVTIMLADGQFESMRGDIADLHVHLHIVARDEHVPEIERYIRTIKERTRASYNVMPFRHVPPMLVIEMVYSAVWWRNMFPLLAGISTTQSPAEIVLNRKLDHAKHCGIELFEYAQTHEEHDNTMSTRTVGAIATRPTGDGSYNFINLSTGRVINRRSFTRLPLPEDAITRVHHLARRAKAATNLTFTNRDNIDLDTLYADLDRDEDDLPLEDAETAGVDDDYEDDDNESDEDYDPNEDEDDESDEDYDPNEDDDDDDTDSDDNDDGYGNEAAEDHMAGAGVYDESGVETTGVDDDETAGVDNVVDDNKPAAAVDDDETAGVDDDETVR